MKLKADRGSSGYREAVRVFHPPPPLYSIHTPTTHPHHPEVSFSSSHIFPFFSFVLSRFQRYVPKWDFNYTIKRMRAQEQREMVLRYLLTTIREVGIVGLLHFSMKLIVLINILWRFNRLYTTLYNCIVNLKSYENAFTPV